MARHVFVFEPTKKQIVNVLERAYLAAMEGRVRSVTMAVEFTNGEMCDCFIGRPAADHLEQLDSLRERIAFAAEGGCYGR